MMRRLLRILAAFVTVGSVTYFWAFKVGRVGMAPGVFAGLVAAVLANQVAYWARDYRLVAEKRKEALSELEQANELIIRRMRTGVIAVDENDRVRFYSEGERIFPRSPGVIGRKVQNCHPPKSVHMVQEILDSFRAGTQSVAEFWIQMGGKFIHIRYFAVRDSQGEYRGTLEMSQDLTPLRALEGERRLADTDRPADTNRPADERE